MKNLFLTIIALAALKTIAEVQHNLYGTIKQEDETIDYFDKGIKQNASSILLILSVQPKIDASEISFAVSESAKKPDDEKLTAPKKEYAGNEKIVRDRLAQIDPKLRDVPFYVIQKKGQNNIIISSSDEFFNNSRYAVMNELSDIEIKNSIANLSKYIFYTTDTIVSCENEQKKKLIDFGFSDNTPAILSLTDIAARLINRGILKQIYLSTDQPIGQSELDEIIEIKYENDRRVKEEQLIPLSKISKIIFYEPKEIYNINFPSCEDVLNHLTTNLNPGQSNSLIIKKDNVLDCFKFIRTKNLGLKLYYSYMKDGKSIKEEINDDNLKSLIELQAQDIKFTCLLLNEDKVSGIEQEYSLTLYLPTPLKN